MTSWSLSLCSKYLAPQSDATVMVYNALKMHCDMDSPINYSLHSSSVFLETVVTFSFPKTVLVILMFLRSVVL